MKYIFISKTDASVRPNNILVKLCSTSNYGGKSLTAWGPEIWNQLP